MSYFQRNLNRQLKTERAFPLILSANYNTVIRPRGDILKDRVKGNFELQNAFFHDDVSFCKYWGVEMSELKKAKALRKRDNDKELDYLWSYVHKM